MYETELSSQKVYYTKSKGYGDPIELYGYTKDGETPMSLLNMSLASCVSMCVQSYYFKKFKKDSIDLKTYAKYDDRKFLIDISLSETLDKKEKTI
ncbi:OsmC family peroxiredoxin [Streptococcus didelphis]|uniref:OsmC family peroxiredoxin n=1 Tax=Streptococcus didelphis TaxID=102886 RepID=UPI0027D24D5E|nr:OsmC family peroxiredoxin [Streptococcus didelphis]WMB29053.1 OsmC family peroxiredoxin [Streptococcus didelphis]